MDNTKILTKVEAAVASAGRVFFYSSATFLTGTIAASVFNGSTNQVPNIETLKGWGIGAAFAGGTALVAFVKNMAAPRSQVVK